MINAPCAALCKLCGGNASRFVERNGFAILQCGACGFMFAAIPDDYDLASVYGDDTYWNGGCEYGYSGGIDKYWKSVGRFYEARAARIAALQGPGQLLEIGAAAGHFLKAAKSHGFEVAGVELSSAMRERCAAMVGCPPFSSFDEVIASGRRFDCVAMFEVIEHLRDPMAMLAQVRELLVPSGLLALSTPNFDFVEATRDPAHYQAFSPPAHISYFGIKTLPDSVARAGLKVIAVEGLFGEHEPPLPRALQLMLTPFRKGTRTRPRGLLGKLLKAYARRREGALCWAETLELYARRI